MTRWRELLLAVLVLAAASSALIERPAPFAGGPGAARVRRPDVVLITIDAMRADRLSASGYHRKLTPFIDSVAAAGVRFRRAYSVSSWTAPSLASLMTGVFPTTHGVLHGSFRMGAVRGQEVIPESLVRWPERMQAAGYTTFGVTANGHLAKSFGFARGFDRYRCVGFRDSHEVRSVLAEWREAILGSEPYFLWVHLFEPHGPYRPHEPWFGEYYQGAARPELVGVSPVKDYARRLDLTRRDDERLGYVVALYDSEVAYSDSVVREIVTELGVGDDDLLVVTADHGEEFLDHGFWGHGQTLYEESTRIPLVLRLPYRRNAGQVVELPVSLLDLPPTVLDLVGAGRRPEGWDGRSLLPLIGDYDPPALPVYTHLSRGSEVRGLIDGRFKYLYHPRKPAESELFDLAADPGERHNLAGSRPAQAAAMRRQLIERAAALGRRRHATARAALTPAQVEALRAMGYVE